MEMNRMINKENIIFDYEAQSKEEVLQKVAEILRKNNLVSDQEEVFKGYVAREEEGTTGFGMGIAIPHCKSEAVKEAAIVIVTLKDEVDWQALDDQPVNYVIALAIPAHQAGTLHLELLGALASNLMEDDFVESLLSIKDKEALAEFLKANILEEK